MDFKKINFRKRHLRLLILAISLFIFSAFLSDIYVDHLRSSDFLRGGWGVLLFFIVMIVDVLLAVVSILPLIPVASAIWGPFLAGVYLTLGWTAGSMLAFWLGRKFGERFICRFFSFCSLDRYKGFIPKEKLFFFLVLSRIFLPLDLLSYAFGVFTKMSYRSYFSASFLGIGLFSFAFSYGARIPFYLQIFFGIVLVILSFFGYREIKNKIN